MEKTASAIEILLDFPPDLSNYFATAMWTILEMIVSAVEILLIFPRDLSGDLLL